VLHLHQVAQGTFTPRLLGIPSTQLNRIAASWTAVSVGLGAIAAILAAFGSYPG
jgi:hypothetical protein